MAEHASNHITYYLLLDKSCKDDLGAIRNWSNLKIAFDENAIWLKDFDYTQIHSAEVRSIPYKTIYYTQGNKLFLQNSRLPERNVPSLLWTPIERGLPVSLPSFNHNYFGIEQRLKIKLIRADEEREGVVMMTSVKQLGIYLAGAPVVRLQKLMWVLLNYEKVVVFGTPLLPIPGDVYWRNKDMLFPAGYNLELHALAETINEKINPDKTNWVIWQPDATYILIDKEQLRPLSFSSFRLTTNSKAVNYGI